MDATVAWAVRARPALFRRVQRATDGCVLSGPAGSGKTTAAREALDAAGQPYVIVHGFDGLADVAFAALNAACTDVPAGRSPADADIVRLLRGWLSTLVARDVWVIVDDADSIDPPSAGLLSYVAQTEGLHLVVTLRTDHELPADLDRLALHRAWPTITVEPWSTDEVADALADALHGAVDPRLSDELHRLSEGSPLVLRELVLAAVDRGSITREPDDRGEPRWTGAASVASPRDAARLVGRRLPAGGPALAVLQTLATAGPIRPALLDRLATREVLVGLDADGLLEFPDGTGDAFVRLSHPMVAEALRAGVDDAERRRLLHDVVAAARDLDGTDDRDRMQYLRWVVEIGEPVPAEDLRDGYHLAVRRFDYALAADIAGAIDRREPSAEAAIFHAVALARASRYAESVAIADAARPLAADDDEVVAIARLLVRLHSPIGHAVGFVDGEVAKAADAAAWADARLGVPAFARLLEAFRAFIDGDLLRACEIGQEILAVAERAPAGLLEEVDQFLVMAAQLAGRFDLARSSQARLATHDARSLAIPAIMGSHGARVSLLMYDGRLREAFDEDDRAYETARQALAYDEMMNAAGQRGMRAFLMGDLPTAIGSLELSLQYQVAPTARGFLVRSVLAAAHVLHGDHERALLVLEVSPEAPARVDTEILNLDHAHLAAMVRALAGDVEHQEERIRAAADGAHRIGYHWLHVLARVSLVRLGWANEHDARAVAETRATVDAALIDAAAELTIAAVTGDVARLDALADELAAMDARLFAVDAARAAVRLAAADVDRRAAEGRDDAAAREELARLRRRLADATRACPGLVDLDQAPAASTDPRLSDRERAIATRAGAGATSKEIAAELHLSPRTVDNNLRRIYTKLGVRGRGELAQALAEAERA